MDIKKLRQSFGKKANKYTDEELMDIENRMRVLADIVIDSYLAKTPAERKEICDKYEKEQLEKNARKKSKVK